MNAGPGQRDREPLTPEEREWAQRLSRLGPSAGPPSAIDARILAAAHAAVATPRARPSRRRWPVALGVAASLVLAVGVAWRLRPLPEPPQASSAIAPMPQRGNGGPAPLPEPVEAPSAPVVKMEPPAEPKRELAEEHVQRAPAPTAAAAAPPIVADEARALDAVAADAATSALASPPPPPAPPAPEAAQAQAAEAAANADMAAGAAAPSPQESERMQKATEAVSAQRAKALAAPGALYDRSEAKQRREAQAEQNPEIVGRDDGDEPPAYADSPPVREAWLRRVRELIAEGHRQEAHDSLDEFKRRYPDYALPQDLRDFEKTRPEPAP